MENNVNPTLRSVVRNFKADEDTLTWPINTTTTTRMLHILFDFRGIVKTNVKL